MIHSSLTKSSTRPSGGRLTGFPVALLCHQRMPLGVEIVATGIGLARTQMKGCTVSSVDKAKNKAQEAKGHVKQAAGKATDDRSLEAEGKSDKVAGNLKQAGEKIKDAVKK